MAKELDGILDSSEAEPAKSCITSDGSTSYLEKIITPIYQTMSAVGSSMEVPV
jgi:callose synthase